MRSIVVGAGEVGWHLAGYLAREGHEVVVVDQDRDLLERRAEAGADVRCEKGDATSPRDLKRLGAAKADVFVSVTANDATNLLGCLLARDLGTRHTMARVRNPDYYAEGADRAEGTLGVDVLVSPELAAVGDLESALRVRGAVRVEAFADELLAIAECLVPDSSPAARRTVVTRPRATRSRICAIIRGGRSHLATRETTVLPGDHVILAAPREELKAACKEIDPLAQPVRRVAIFGAGRIGVPLAQRLATGRREVVLLERDEHAARQAAEQLDDPLVEVLWEEGASEQALREAGLDTADAFVSCAGDDRATLLACTHARRLGVGLVLAVISRPEFAPVAEALGVDGTIAPRLAAAEALLRTARGGNVQRSSVLTDGLEALQYRLGASSPLVGRPVAASLPDGTVLGAVVRDGEVYYAEALRTYREHDDVVVLATGSTTRKLAKVFGP